MSERDNADRLNRSWDEFVGTPRGARGNSGDVDPTVTELHAMEQPESPDPEFRLALRQQLLREASFRTGQQRAESVFPTRQSVVPADRRFNRWMESIAIVVVVVLVGSALIWALQIRSDRDDELTPTLELAATSPSLIVASPFVTASPSASPFASINATPTIESSPSVPPATPTAEATETMPSTPQATQSALDILSSPTSTASPVATEQVDACAEVMAEIGAISSTLGEPSLPSEIAAGTPAVLSQVSSVNRTMVEFTGCLAEMPVEDLRSLVTDALLTLGVSQLDSFAHSHQIADLAVLDHTISEVNLLPDGRLSAVITLSDDSQFVGIFEIDDVTSTARIVQIYSLTLDVPTATVIVDNTQETFAPVSDDGVSGDSSDDDDSAGEDDDGGDDD